MLTLSRAGSAITCQLEHRAQSGVMQVVQGLTRSLQRTLVSFPLTLVQ